MSKSSKISNLLKSCGFASQVLLSSASIPMPTVDGYATSRNREHTIRAARTPTVSFLVPILLLFLLATPLLRAVADTNDDSGEDQNSALVEGGGVAVFGVGAAWALTLLMLL